MWSCEVFLCYFVRLDNLKCNFLWHFTWYYMSCGNLSSRRASHCEHPDQYLKAHLIPVFNSFAAGGNYRRHAYRVQMQRNDWTAQRQILFNVTYRLINRHCVLLWWGLGSSSVFGDRRVELFILFLWRFLWRFPSHKIKMLSLGFFYFNFTILYRKEQQMRHS